MMSEMNQSKNESNGSSSGDVSMFLQDNVQSITNATEKLIKSSLHVFGHKHSSSYDASYINTEESKEVSYIYILFSKIITWNFVIHHI